MAKQKPQFNKITAFDEFISLMHLPPNPKASESIQSLLNAQDYLQKIHDDAFGLGFEKGCEATKIVDKL
jgi:hypothetical protein